MDNHSAPTPAPSNSSSSVSIDNAIEAALLILDQSGRHAAAEYLREHGVSFRTTVRVLGEPLKRRKNSARSI